MLVMLSLCRHTKTDRSTVTPVISPATSAPTAYNIEMQNERAIDQSNRTRDNIIGRNFAREPSKGKIFNHHK